MEQMVARAKSKQNSTHDSHVVTAAPRHRKKIGLYLLHFGRLPLPSFLLFHSGACIDSGPSKFNERVDARRKLRDTTPRLGWGERLLVQWTSGNSGILVFSQRTVSSLGDECNIGHCIKRALFVGRSQQFVSKTYKNLERERERENLKMRKRYIWICSYKGIFKTSCREVEQYK